MPRLTGYVCADCGYEDEVLYNDTEVRVEVLKTVCPECGGKMVKDDIKKNCHRWNHNDRGGI